jgi:DNA helicase-2/ATP-dependent DNA helicase PcrA
VLREFLVQNDVPVSVTTAEGVALNEPWGRRVLAALRLVSNVNDHLAWRALLQLRNNGVGPGAIGAVYELAKERGVGFADALKLIEDDPSPIASTYRNKLRTEIRAIRELLASLAPQEGEAVMESVRRMAEGILKDEDQQRCVLAEMARARGVSDAESISEALRAIEASNVDIEQEIEDGKVNILTMHKAKGLTAKAVLIVAAEDEYLPGRAEGEAIGDERRLLYVSLTRAMHHLFVTYCEHRTGQQRHTGRTSGTTGRSLTRFLRDGPIAPVNGIEYVERLQKEPKS